MRSKPTQLDITILVRTRSTVSQLLRSSMVATIVRISKPGPRDGGGMPSGLELGIQPRTTDH